MLFDYTPKDELWNFSFDWGEIYPHLHFYSGKKFTTTSSSKDVNPCLTMRLGLIYGFPTYGCVVELSRDCLMNKYTS